MKDGRHERVKLSPWKLRWYETNWHLPRYPAFWDCMTFCQRPDFDHGGAAMVQLQEMLIQAGAAGSANHRKIYLLPAWPKDWNVDFKLHAPYQTTVECIFRDGEIKKLKVLPRSRLKDVVDMTRPEPSR